jgi:hypothetical protein
LDTIQAEYGWKDAYILDLPLDRILQILKAIKYRKTSETHLELKKLELSVKTLAMFISHTAYPAKKGKNIKALLRAAKDISFTGERSEKSMDNEKKGSYEALRGMFR